MKIANRTTKKEQLSAQRLLRTIEGTKYLLSPYSIEHRQSPEDRPDFLLKTNGQEVGIEETMATSEKLQQYKSLVRKSDTKPDFIEPDYFIRPTTISSQEMKELLTQDEAQGTGSLGNCQVEIGWFQFIVRAIVKKSEDFNKSGFQKFEQNWLLIDDETPCIRLDKTIIELILSDNLCLVKNIKFFDKIFIITGWQDVNENDLPGVVAYSTNTSELEFLVMPRKNCRTVGPFHC